MTEKRCKIHNFLITLDGVALTNEQAADLINELLEDNRILKMQVENKLYSRRQLESFHDKVLEVIVDKIKEVNNARNDATNRENRDAVICFLAMEDLLNELKKELESC